MAIAHPACSKCGFRSAEVATCRVTGRHLCNECWSRINPRHSSGTDDFPDPEKMRGETYGMQRAIDRGEF